MRILIGLLIGAFAMPLMAADSNAVWNHTEIPYLPHPDSLLGVQSVADVVYKEVVRPTGEKNDWVFLFFLLLPVFSLFSYSFRNYLFENLRVIFNHRLADQLMREREFANGLPRFILLLLCSISVAAILYRPWQQNPWLEIPYPWITLPLLSLVWPLAYLLRHLVYRLFAVIYRLQQVVNQFRFRTGVLYETAGFLLFPVCSLMWMVNEPAVTYISYFALGILAILWLLRWIVQVRLAFGMPNFQLSYYLLYFCAFEAAPIVILVSIITGRFSM